jgi:hypothetical protein
VPLYQDPTGPRAWPSLVEDLFALSMTHKQHPLENQATAALAWLIDRSPAFARTIVACFLGDGAVPDVSVGARTQLSLPKPGGGVVFPDLSIEGAGGSFQLLVESKVWSDFHVYGHPVAGPLRQDAHYRLLWQELPGRPGSEMRAVGTLTRAGGPATPDVEQMVAADVAWSQARDVLAGLVETGQLGEDVRLVAQSYLAAMKTVVIGEPPDLAAAKAWLDEYESLVHAVVGGLQRALGGVRISSTGGRWFRAERLRLKDRTAFHCTCACT